MHPLPHLRRDRTRAVAEAQRSLSSLYDTAFAVAADDRSGFTYEIAALTDTTLAAASLRIGGLCRVASEAFPSISVGHAVAGRHRWRVGKESGNGEVPFIVAPGNEFRAEFRNLHFRSLWLEPDVLRNAVQAITGRDLVSLQMSNLNGGARHPHLIAENLRFLEATMIEFEDLSGLPLVRSAIAQQTILALLACFPLADLDDVDERQLAPPAVRRAAAYIDDHAHEPISISDIARFAGVSTRALQSAFQRAFSLTPSQYLRRVRLNGARRALVESDPLTESVGTIARRWGFAHAGRFAQFYLTEFGELPYQTLRR